MDPFGFQNRFPGQRTSHHRYSQSSTHHPDLSFSSLMHTQLPTGQSAGNPSQLSNGVAYESHDDLCVEHCPSVGVYNGSQYLPHRAPAAMPTGWPGRAMSSHFDYPMDMGAGDMQARSFVTSFSNPFQQDWYGHDTHSGFAQSCLGTDEDCISMDSCCDSQCTMTGKCDNLTCDTKDDACTDQTCPDAARRDEIVDGAAAAALLSINHGPGQPTSHDLSYLDYDFSAFQHALIPPTVTNVANHILQAHGNADSSACPEPCLLNDLSDFASCGMPIYHNPAPFGNHYPTNTNFQFNQDFHTCQAKFQTPEDYILHFNEQHRPFFAAMPNGFSSIGRPRGSVIQSVETMSSSPTTPLDTTDSGASSHTPSPMTPMSTSMDMSDMKHLGTADRSTSISSVAEHQNHQCLWRDEGAESICGETFPTPEELFAHAAGTHIKNAKKGDSGFRCGWHDCPRSEASAAGFPQRSKIERHMQTHIDHKPHVCPKCNKGFSAKQALKQHMYIHADLKPLVCEVCGKAFRYPSALTMHQRVHSGEKPLQCNICGKSFSESSNLSKHKRTHEVRGRFSCVVPGCDRNFHRQDQLRRHMKTHQKDGGTGPVDILAGRLESVFEDS